MEHLYFTLFNFAIFAVVLFIDRKRIKDYFLICILGLIGALIFENTTTYLGFWFYHSEPKIIFVSFYTWILYVPYLAFCYFAGQKLFKVGRNGK